MVNWTLEDILRKYFYFFNVLILIAGIYLIYEFRFLLFSNWQTISVGKISFKEDNDLSNKINLYFEKYYRRKNSRPYNCGHQFWGQDKKYVYIDLVCGNFKKTNKNEIKTLYGLQSATRIELTDHLEILDFDQPVNGTYYSASYNWLFPVEVQQMAKKLKVQAPWNNIHLMVFERSLKK